MMDMSHFRNVAVINYLVKRLQGKSSQVGKTVIQKLMFCLDCCDVADYGYSLYHYGPYSPFVASELEYAEHVDGVEIRWEADKGYFITPGEKVDSFEHLLEQDGVKEKIDKIVDALGKFRTKELSLFTTALYLRIKKSCTDEDELFQRTQSLKPQYSDQQIKDQVEIVLKICPSS